VKSADLAGRVRIHDLRHAHASWLLGGADLQVVKQRLGHGGPRVERLESEPGGRRGQDQGRRKAFPANRRERSAEASRGECVGTWQLALGVTRVVLVEPPRKSATS
jgi:integrase